MLGCLHVLASAAKPISGEPTPDAVRLDLYLNGFPSFSKRLFSDARSVYFALVQFAALVAAASFFCSNGMLLALSVATACAIKTAWLLSPRFSKSIGQPNNDWAEANAPWASLAIFATAIGACAIAPIEYGVLPVSNFTDLSALGQPFGAQEPFMTALKFFVAFYFIVLGIVFCIFRLRGRATSIYVILLEPDAKLPRENPEQFYDAEPGGRNVFLAIRQSDSLSKPLRDLWQRLSVGRRSVRLEWHRDQNWSPTKSAFKKFAPADELEEEFLGSQGLELKDMLFAFSRFALERFQQGGGQRNNSAAGQTIHAQSEFNEVAREVHFSVRLHSPQIRAYFLLLSGFALISVYGFSFGKVPSRGWLPFDQIYKDLLPFMFAFVMFIWTVAAIYIRTIQLEDIRDWAQAYCRLPIPGLTTHLPTYYWHASNGAGREWTEQFQSDFETEMDRYGLTHRHTFDVIHAGMLVSALELIAKLK